MQEQFEKMNFDKDMTPQQRYLEAMKYDRLKKIEDQLTDALKDLNKEAVKIVTNEMVNVYKLNYNFEADKFGGSIPIIDKSTIKQVLSGQVTPFKQLAIDDLKNASQIRSKLTTELLNGIMQGDSINGLAKRIRNVTEGTLASSVRIARTETTRVEASARMDVGKQGEKLGFKMKKQWVSTNDDSTRPAHNHADGQIVDIDKPFIVGGEELMYPGDEAGSAWNTINCRCTVVNIIVEE